MHSIAAKYHHLSLADGSLAHLLFQHQIIVCITLLMQFRALSMHKLSLPS